MITRSKAQRNQPSSKDNKRATTGKQSILGKNKEQNPADCKMKLTQAKQMFNRCWRMQKKWKKNRKRYSSCSKHSTASPTTSKHRTVMMDGTFLPAGLQQTQVGTTDPIGNKVGIVFLLQKEKWNRYFLPDTYYIDSTKFLHNIFYTIICLHKPLHTLKNLLYVHVGSIRRPFHSFLSNVFSPKYLSNCLKRSFR